MAATGPDTQESDPGIAGALLTRHPATADALAWLLDPVPVDSPAGSR
jgi:hypothetical protein